MNHTKLLALLVLLSAAILGTSSAHECEHDKLMEEFYKKFGEEFAKNKKHGNFVGPDDRKLASAGAAKLRVTTDTTALNSGTITTTQKTYLTSVINTAANFLSQFLKVIPSATNNVFSNGAYTTCIDVAVPTADRTTGIANSDLHLYVIYESNSSATYLANAGWCAFYNPSSAIIRPNFGRVKFNIGLMLATGTDKNQYQSDIMVALHEIIHVLGFSGGSIQYWLDTSVGALYGADTSKITTTQTIRGFSTTVLKSPNVLATARKYYNCNTLTGMQLENQGGAGSLGSHWERTIIESEVMTSSAIFEGSNLTYFTAALLKDTGYWDDVNENLTDPIYWGKNKGCNFPVQGCQASPSFEEFPPLNEKGCTFWNDGQGISVIESFSDNCSYRQAYSNRLCEDPKLSADPTNTSANVVLNDFNYNSKCFVSNVMNPINPTSISTSSLTRCHKYSCSSDKTTITISSTYLAGYSVICGSSDQGVIKNAIYSSSTIGQVTCPSNYKKFCDNQTCQNYCTFNGICIRGNCLCNTGFSGEDCSIVCPVYSDNGGCVTSCPGGKYANPDNTCKATCPDGYFTDSGVCTLCDFSCSTCTAGLSTNCTACQFLTYLSGNTCVSICPTGKYANDTTKICETCPTGCADCTSATVCGSCLINFIIQGTLCASSTCNAPCLTCGVLATECLTCASGKFLNSTAKTCVLSGSCPSATYQNSTNNTCSTCSTGCTTCSSATICSACNTGSGYRLLGSSCTLCTSPCSTCLATDITKCTSCESSQYLLINTCYITCPIKYYNASGYVCSSCITGCNVCSDMNSCTTCDIVNSYQSYVYLSKSICINSSSCFSPCLTCTTAFQPEQCSTCQASFVRQGTVCKTACDPGFYSNAGGVCTICNSLCSTCSTTDTTCTACTGLKFLSKATCVIQCPSGTKGVNNVCVSAQKLILSILSLFAALLFIL